jgi:hypothetical protein
LLWRHDSELLILISDHSHFSRSDSLVDPYVFIDGLDLLKHPHETNANHNKTASLFSIGSTRPPTVPMHDAARNYTNRPAKAITIPEMRRGLLPRPDADVKTRAGLFSVFH